MREEYLDKGKNIELCGLKKLLTIKDLKSQFMEKKFN